MVWLTKVAYDLNSPYGAVQACLQKKREVSQSRQQGGVTGISSGSCCAFVEYLDSSGNADTVFGNSRIRMPYFDGNASTVETRNRAACYHGELSALWHVIEDEGVNPDHILSIYIEMSPCGSCRPALDNLLGDRQVLYSFDYGIENSQWVAAANALCRS